MTDQTDQLKKLREPFEKNQITLKPKPYEKDSPKGKCKECGGYHGLPAMHLEAVGHAALTHRLLEVDLLWGWEPLSLDANGLPQIDKDGGLWIKLTVCGMTRLGYGDAQGKTGPDATKERIGDALRNAAMRFGAALDLWHKGGVLDLDPERHETPLADKWVMKAGGATTEAALATVWADGVAEISEKGDKAAYNEFKAAVTERKKELVPAISPEDADFARHAGKDKE